jgi:DNA-binding transcriptional regulator YiaG
MPLDPFEYPPELHGVKVSRGDTRSLRAYHTDKENAETFLATNPDPVVVSGVYQWLRTLQYLRSEVIGRYLSAGLASAALIRTMRENSALSKAELARRAHLHPRTISNYERGITVPTRSRLVRVLTGCGATALAA